MLLISVRSIRNGIAGVIIEGKLCDLIAALAIFLIAKSRMIGIELHDIVPIREPFIHINRDHARIDVIGKQLVCFRIGFYHRDHTPKTKPATNPSPWKDRWPVWKLVFESTSSTRDSPSPTVPPGGERTVITVAIAIA